MSVGFLVVNLCAADQEHTKDNTQYQKIKISNSLSMLSNKGGNVLISEGEDGILLIDNGYSELAEDLKIILAGYQSVKPLQYIINTHWHFDHTGGNETLGKGANIIAHDRVRQRLQAKRAIPLFNYEAKALPKYALPTLTYSQTMKVHFNEDELQLVHFANSHTDGDTVVFFKEANVVHMGDIMFNADFPFIDIHNGGNVFNYVKSVKRIYQRIDDETVVIPGHGAMTNKAGVQVFLTMLEATLMEVEIMKAKGMDLIEIKEQGLDKKWQAWGKGFIDEENWISFIYQGL